MTTPETAELFLVAGPSGAGKTIFINQFRSGELAPDILSQLPAAARRWPQIGGNDCMKRGVPLARVLPQVWTAAGGVVHYDTAYPFRFGLSSFDQDPISELFSNARRLHVVSINPPAEVLRAQFDERRARQRLRKKASHLFWRDRVRTPLERLKLRIRGVEMRDTADLYENPQWIIQCYERWNAYVQRLIEQRPPSRAIVLEPAIEGQTPAFRVISGG